MFDKIIPLARGKVHPSLVDAGTCPYKIEPQALDSTFNEGEHNERTQSVRARYDAAFASGRVQQHVASLVAAVNRGE